MRVTDFRMPLRFLRGSALQASLTVGALACGVALVCAIDLVNGAVLRAFTEVIDTMAGRAALSVRAGAEGFFAEETAVAVAGVPGVELAVPVVSARAFTADESGALLTIHGLDVTDEAVRRVYVGHDDRGLDVDDPLVFVSQPDSVALTRAFAARRGLALGDGIELLTPGGRRRFTMRALLDPAGVSRVYGGNLVVMDLFAAEAAFTRPGLINRLDVVVRNGEDLARVQDAVQAVLPAGLRAETPAQRKADVHRLVRSLQVMLEAVGLVGLVAAFLIAFNRLTTVFEARVGQVAVLRALGVRPRAVWTELVKEALLLGALGVAIGLPLGIGLGHLMLPAVAATTALNCKLVASDAGLWVRPWSVALAAALGLAAAFLAAALPAFRAARVTVAETLRGRGVEPAGMRARWTWLARVLGMGAIALAVVAQWLTRSATWGLIATALAAVGTALAAGPLLAFARPPLAMLGAGAGPTWRFAVEAVGRNARRSALTIGMLGVGLGAVFWFRTVARSFEQTVVESLAPALHADLAVNSAHVATGFVEEPIAEAIGAELEALPGVASVASTRIVDWPLGDGTIAINAFDPKFFRTGEFGRYPLFGARGPDVWEAIARGEAVLVSSNLALNLQVHVGDRIVLESPGGPVSLRVAGMTNDFTSARGAIEMSRDVYRRFWRDTAITRAFVHAVPGTDLDGLRDTIARRLGSTWGLRIYSSGELMEHFASEVRRAFAAVDVLRVVVLLLVLVGLADTLGAGVAERTRELGTLRALGVRPRHLRRIVLGEALVIAGLGLVLAAAAGLGLAALWVEATFSYLLGWVVALHVPLAEAALTAAAALTVAALAAVLPGRRAAAVQVAAALRCE